MRFPFPAKNTLEDYMDLSEYLIQDPSDTYYFRVSDDSMINASMPHNALLVIDTSVKPISGMIILTLINSELMVRRLVQTRRSLVLHPENPAFKPVVVTKEMNMQLYGVVTAVIVKYI